MLKTIKYLAFLFIISLTQPLWAYELFPISLTLDEVGRGSAGVFRLQNTNERPLTIEVTAARRLFEDGYYNETEPAEDDFLIMPPQAYIEPGEFQVFRVRYLGETQLNQSAGYRIIFRQLPVDLGPLEGSGVRFVMHVHAPVFVSPVGVEPRISSTIDFTPLHDETRFDPGYFDVANEDGVIVLTNHGDGMQDLSLGRLEVTSEHGETLSLPWSEFSRGVFVRYLLPGGESRIPVEGLGLEVEGKLASVRFVSTE
ncbi:fimbria/pilus periplasmic chaperone [Aliidiomarina minuta]|nr:fimbria/pilus periplasmic chaperone [Aliidiomarina minuta]